jgi:MFS family permease
MACDSSSSLGAGVGLALNLYILSLFIPKLTAEFGWSKSDFALTGKMSLLAMVSIPLFGRLADRFGTRLIAISGVIAVPLSYFTFSLMTGDISQYFAICPFLLTFGAGTSTVVYGRIVAHRIEKARGIGLALMVCGPPLVGA